MPNNAPELSKAEYDILRVLWKRGKSTVREAHDELTITYGWAYSTTKTMMDRMTQKHLLKREAFHGIFLYRPLIKRPEGMMKMIKFFSDRVFELDYRSVVSLFAQSEAITPDEIEELTRLLEEDDASSAANNPPKTTESKVKSNRDKPHA